MRMPHRATVGLRAALALLLALGAATSGCDRGGTTAATGKTEPTSTTAQQGELTVAIAGMITPEEGIAYYDDLSRYVASKVGLQLHLFHKAEYAEVNEMLKERKVDMAFVCSGPYVTGHDEFGLELLAAPQVNGAPEYFAYVIVPATSTVTSLEGLRGKTFAFTDPESNTGMIVPTFLVSKMGLTPETFFGRTFFTYSHDTSIKAVATGQADGASVDSLIYDYAARTDPTYTSRTKIVARSDPFGIPPVVVHPAMDENMKRALAEALVGAAEDPEGRAILDKMGIDRFVPVSDSAYDSIRRMNEFVAGEG